MKLSISNIAWDTSRDGDVLAKLAAMGVTGIEVAPSKNWPNWQGISAESIALYRHSLETYGFKIPALQAILFGRPELQVFKRDSHAVFFEHVKMLAQLAAGLGAEVLVFGAPKNRQRHGINIEEAYGLAEVFFLQLATICSAEGVCLGLEPNPVEYDCDFLVTAAEVQSFVARVNHPGLKVHLDSAALYMEGADIAREIESIADFCHFHVSEPMLQPIVAGKVDQRAAIETLQRINYRGWISIEMRDSGDEAELFESVAEVLAMMAAQ